MIIRRAFALLSPRPSGRHRRRARHTGGPIAPPLAADRVDPVRPYHVAHEQRSRARSRRTLLIAPRPDWAGPR
jgi:hypothetical protein